MAKTYSVIQTFTLTTTTSSVVFSNIPQNFNDLLIKVSSRKTTTGVDTEGITVNGAALSSARYMDSNGSNGATPRSGNVTIYQGLAQPSDYTSLTFSNTEYYIPGYTNSYYKTITGNSVIENNGSATYQGRTSSIYGSNSAVTSLTLTMNSSNYAAGSTFTLYGIGGGARATGGTISYSNGYTYHTFTSTGLFIATEQIKNAECLLIAGGGGGGGDRAGGGGAGGLRYVNSLSFTAATVYPTVVGAGGTFASGGTGASHPADGGKGTNSSFSVLYADGGGGGAEGGSVAWSGGSGGGAGATENGANPVAVALGNVGGFSPSEGNNGGVCAANNGTYYSNGAAGGGGAGAVGSNGGNGFGGNGGAGSNNYSSWASATNTGVLSNGTYYYAGGGGGGVDTSSTAGTGGVGGGGNGQVYNSTGATAGTANTGSGGGGGGGRNGAVSGSGSGTGGSGLVIIRYPSSALN